MMESSRSYTTSCEINEVEACLFYVLEFLCHSLKFCSLKKK